MGAFDDTAASHGLRVLGPQPHRPYYDLLLLNILFLGKEQDVEVLGQVFVQLLLVTDHDFFKLLQIARRRLHLEKRLNDLPEKVLLNVIVFELLTDDVDQKQQEGGQEFPNVDAGFLVAAGEIDVLLDLVFVHVGLVGLEPDDIL